jgi:hypothetical protein
MSPPSSPARNCSRADCAWANTWSDGKYEAALFGRNITDEVVAVGAIDFDNLTGFLNEPQIWACVQSKFLTRGTYDTRRCRSVSNHWPMVCGLQPADGQRVLRDRAVRSRRPDQDGRRNHGAGSAVLRRMHNVPSPGILPKRSWPAVIRTMADIGKQRTGREYIPADVLRDITALYYGSSPTELPTLPFDEVPSPGRTFVRRELAAQSTNPTILNISATRLRARSPQQFLVCDGDQGKLQLLEKSGKKWKEKTLADIAIPIHTQVIDFDADGDLDIVVADLGLMPPVGALGGKVYLLRQDPSATFSRELLQGDLHRVSDARALGP